MRPLSLQELMARQGSVLSRHQALAAGLTSHAWDWRLSSGRWQSLLPGIAVAHSGGVSQRERAWAAVLYGGPHAALDGQAGLALHGVSLAWGRTGNRTVLDIAVPLSRQLRRVTLPCGASVIARRMKDAPRWATTRQALPLIRAEAAVLHAAAWATTDEQAEMILIATVQQRKTALPLVRRALAEMPELTRRALVREVLDDLELGAHAVSERRFLRLCRQQGLSIPDELQLRVRAGASTYYLDARYRRARLTVEVDGAHHADAGTWDADALRSLRLVAAMPGEQVVRITTGMLRNHGEEVAVLLRAILVGRAAA